MDENAPMILLFSVDHDSDNETERNSSSSLLLNIIFGILFLCEVEMDGWVGIKSFWTLAIL